MAVINHAKREINAKIVYYGPPAVGKGSLFRYIHQRIRPTLCGPLKSMPAGGATLQFFDYLPFEQPGEDGYRIRFHLYTLTGVVDNPATWKMVLKGVDGLAIVLPAGCERQDESASLLRQLDGMLASYGTAISVLPSVQLLHQADKLERQADNGTAMELAGRPLIRSSVVTGEGVLQTLATLSQEVVRSLRQQQLEEVAGPATLEPLSVSEPAAVVADSPAAQPSLAEAELPLVVAGETTILRVPVMVQVGGRARRVNLQVSIQIEEDDDASDGV